ncbi:MAG: RnfABCDGE type electron transport complex subunit D [Ruminococcaceae bacterium]|nr:RnfABCDGE type electron transport complex subunit D [Oscillospiraceae bacterium]
MYNVSVSPHVRAKTSTRTVMRDVVIALAPTMLFGIIYFGWNAFMLVAVCVASAMASEAIFEFLMKKPITVFDYSAVVTGLILALNLPPTATWWMAVLGSAFAIIPVKLLFGGLGQNFMNPALAGRCFLMISFTGRMTNFAIDGTTSATPLAALKDGKTVDLMQLFIGTHPGCIGEVSAVAILVGFVYLVARKVITPSIPCTYVVSTIAFITIIRLIGGEGVTANYLLGELMSGGLLAGAVFMATDYATSPITNKGKVVFGLIIGLLTALFRTLGSTAEGVSYAIIIGNLLVPLIEKFTVPRPFGAEQRISLQRPFGGEKSISAFLPFSPQRKRGGKTNEQ